MTGASSKGILITLALFVQNFFFNKEKKRRQQQLLDNFIFATDVVFVVVLALLLFFSLLAFWQTHTLPWHRLGSVADDLLFIVAALLSLHSLMSYGQFLAWQLLVKIGRLFVAHFSRAGLRPPAAEAGPIWPVITLLRENQHQIHTFWRQLLAQLALRPPDLWVPARAPLLLFQQAPLRLAP